MWRINGILLSSPLPGWQIICKKNSPAVWQGSVIDRGLQVCLEECGSVAHFTGAFLSVEAEVVLVTGTAVQIDIQTLKLQEVLGVDGVALTFCHGGETDEVLNLLGLLGIGLVAVAHLSKQLGEEVGHDAGEAGATHVQSLQQHSGVGIVDLQVGALDGIQLCFDLGGVAAGILQELELAGFSHVLQYIRSQLTAEGVGALIDTETVLRQLGQNLVQILQQNIVVLVGLSEPVGDEDIGVNTGVDESVGLVNLAVQIVGGVAGSDNGHALGLVFGDELHQSQALLEIQEPHFAGLANSEDTGHVALVVPVQQLLNSIEVDFVVRSIRCNHSRVNTVRNRIHKNTPFNYLFMIG